jgi:hypothetical protein
MEHIAHTIEQLDLAGKQLQKVNSTSGRFALLLTDNIVELTLHEQCDVEFLSDNTWGGLGLCKYSPNLRKKVLGQHFEQKAKFCRQINLVNDDQLDLIRIAHQYRNELYHTGIKYEPIVYAIAWEYHNFACDLFASARRGGRGYGVVPRDDLSGVVRCHVGDLITEDGNFVDPIKFRQGVADSLKNMKPQLSRSFVEIICDFAIEKVEAVIANIYFLSEDNRRGATETEVLHEIQFTKFLQGYFSTPSSLPGSPAEGFELVRRLRKKWKPKYRSNPTLRWLDRARGLATEKTSVDVLRKFQSLKKDMQEFEEMIEEAAVGFELYIQAQIDQARGK